MKKIYGMLVLTVLFLLGCGSQPQVQTPQAEPITVFVPEETKKITWNTFNDQLLSKAKEQNKRILIYIKSDNCRFCKDMEEYTFTHPKVVELVEDQYLSTSLNINNHEEIIDLFYPDGKVVVPKVILILPTKTPWLIIEVVGYFDAPDMVKILGKADELFKSEEKTPSKPSSVLAP